MNLLRPRNLVAVILLGSAAAFPQQSPPPTPPAADDASGCQLEYKASADKLDNIYEHLPPTPANISILRLAISTRKSANALRLSPESYTGALCTPSSRAGLRLVIFLIESRGWRAVSPGEDARRQINEQSVGQAAVLSATLEALAALDKSK